MSLPLITSSLLLIDGIFHFAATDKTLKENSPDWMIADGLFDTIGLPVEAHRIMGIFLIASSLWSIQDIRKHKNDSKKWSPYTRFYVKTVAPIALTIIGLGLSIKLWNFLKK